VRPHHPRPHDAAPGAARPPRLRSRLSTRTLHLVGALPPAAQADYLSGLLVGHELAALEALAGRPSPLLLVGTDELCQRYRRALDAFGHAPAAIALDATPRGLWRVATSAGLIPRAAAC
jgi:2-dehydro-3-deoxygalactonokinase